MGISDTPPREYFHFPKYASRLSSDMRYWHALPEGWEHMDYQDALVVRRRAIARVIRAGFSRLSE